MNKAFVFAFCAIGALCQISRVIGDDDCRDVTVGSCEFEPNSIIQVVDIFTEIDECQYYCATLADCAVFSFDQVSKICHLLTKDYRTNCNISGGPFDKSIDVCLEVEPNTCDLFIEQDCIYHADVVLQPPIGEILTAIDCEKLCLDFEVLGCEYWVYYKGVESCQLLASGDRTCTAIGGPETPPITECQGLQDIKLIKEGTTINHTTKEEECKDVTVGNCLFEPDSIIQVVDIFDEVDQCQYYCTALADCEIFRFDGTKCHLLTKEYRNKCQISGGPFDKSIEACLQVQPNTCDLFLQEDCTYSSEVLLQTPPGDIPTAIDCELLCRDFEPLGCEYWVHFQANETCQLLTGSEKVCTALGGPESPPLTECQELPSLLDLEREEQSIIQQMLPQQIM